MGESGGWNRANNRPVFTASAAEFGHGGAAGIFLHEVKGVGRVNVALSVILRCVEVRNGVFNIAG